MVFKSLLQFLKKCNFQIAAIIKKNVFLKSLPAGRHCWIKCDCPSIQMQIKLPMGNYTIPLNTMTKARY